MPIALRWRVGSSPIIQFEYEIVVAMFAVGETLKSVVHASESDLYCFQTNFQSEYEQKNESAH